MPHQQREAMIRAGRPPTDEQISQICACQLVSTRLAQAAPNGGSGALKASLTQSKSGTLRDGGLSAGSPVWLSRAGPG
jgi:hypothetical protein